MFHYAHFHSSVSSCHLKKKKKKTWWSNHWNICILHNDWCDSSWQVWKALKCCDWVLGNAILMYFQHFFWAFHVELSLVAIMSKLTKRSKGLLGLLTSSVEILFSCGQGKAKSCLFGLCYLEDRKTSCLHPFGCLWGHIVLMILKLYSCCKFFINGYQNTIIIRIWIVFYIFIIWT